MTMTILIADDECVLREIMAEILMSKGFQVLQASNGLEAMQVFRQHQQDITLALLDVMMPGCCGIELAGKIRAMKPELPIIFVTAYDERQLSGRNSQLIDVEVFTKPVSIDLLIKSIERAANG